MSAPDLKVVLFRENSYPRSVALNAKQIKRILALAGFALLALLATTGFLFRSYLANRVKSAHPLEIQRPGNEDTFGPFNSSEEQAKSLKDEVDRLQAKIQNMTNERAHSGDIDTKNPALALFSPVVTDHAKEQRLVLAKNFSYSPPTGKGPATFSFELHNAEPGQSVQKGYIVILARSKSALLGYPNVFTSRGPYLIDFERGESFQVSRFRMVNAQFDAADIKEPLTHFQILIFKRTGELLLNLLSEVNPK